MAKRRIVDILRDIREYPGGGVVRNAEGRVILHYKTYRDGKYFSHHKDVTCIDTEIEDEWRSATWDEYAEESKLGKGVRRISIRRTFPKGKHDVEDEERWVFVSILKGILVEEVEPISPVYIWRNVGVGDGNRFEIGGFCDGRHRKDIQR